MFKTHTDYRKFAHRPKKKFRTPHSAGSGAEKARKWRFSALWTIFTKNCCRNIFFGGILALELGKKSLSQSQVQTASEFAGQCNMTRLGYKG